MSNIITILFISIIPALFLGDPRDWRKSDIEKENDKQDLGGGIFSWVTLKLGAIISWWIILVAVYIVFVIIKMLWRLA